MENEYYYIPIEESEDVKKAKLEIRNTLEMHRQLNRKKRNEESEINILSSLCEKEDINKINYNKYVFDNIEKNKKLKNQNKNVDEFNKKNIYKNNENNNLYNENIVSIKKNIFENDEHIKDEKIEKNLNENNELEYKNIKKNVNKNNLSKENSFNTSNISINKNINKKIKKNTIISSSDTFSSDSSESYNYLKEIRHHKKRAIDNNYKNNMNDNLEQNNKKLKLHDEKDENYIEKNNINEKKRNNNNNNNNNEEEENKKDLTEIKMKHDIKLENISENNMDVEFQRKKKIFKNLKIHYERLKEEEKLYYHYMIKGLDIKYDFENKNFYTDSIFIRKFKERIGSEKKFNIMGYLEYSCIYLLQWLNPTDEEKLFKLKSLMKLEIIVKSIFPKCKMETFGSFVTGLSLPGCDVDVCFMNIEQDELDVLYLIGYALIKLNICYSIKVIKDAAIKILKYEDSENGINLDICINQKSSRETTDFIVECCKKHVFLKPLTILLKFLLKSRNLNDTYTGGIGSFFLTCMVLHFLQLHPLSIQLKSYESSYLYKLLIEFFHFYNLDYDLNEKCAILRGMGHIIPKKLKTDFSTDDNRLSIENPIDMTLDIGKNTFKMRFILYLFSSFYCSLLSLLNKLMNFEKENYKQHFLNILFPKSKKKNKKDKYIKGNLLNPNSLYPLFFANFIVPDNVIFTKRFIKNFPNMKWSIKEFNFNFTNEQKNIIFNMCYKQINQIINKTNSYENSYNLYSDFSAIFSHTFDVKNNIFTFT